jgi:hypothetical protein
VNLRRLAACTVLAGIFSGTLAQESVADEPHSDVARVAYVSGEVFVQRGDSSDNVDAVVNAPLLDGDIVTTGTGAQAEVHLSRGSHVRLAEDTSIRIANLESNPSEMQIAQGTIELRVLRSGDRAVELDTPSVGIQSNENSAVRVAVLDDGTSKIDIRSGNAELLTPQGNRSLSAGSAIGASGTAANPATATAAPASSDAFDAFNTARDDSALHNLEQEQPANTLDVDGVDDLPSYGHWANTSDGDAWVPNAQRPDWSPYSDGRWAWEPDFGYTWIGAEPWGWAPYHYGRWALEPRIGWAWFPGAYAPWSPALVGFVSGPFGTELSLAWFPLGPGEVNVTIVTGYRNAHVPGAVHVISYSGFAAGHFATTGRLPIGNLRDFSVVRGALPIAPNRSLLTYGGRGLDVSPHPAFTRTTFAGRPYSLTRPGFAQSREAIAATIHRSPVLGHELPANSPITHSVFGPSSGAVAPTKSSSAFGPTPALQHPISSYGATFRRPSLPSASGNASSYGSVQNRQPAGGAVYQPIQRRSSGSIGQSRPYQAQQQPNYRAPRTMPARTTTATHPAPAARVAPRPIVRK